MKDVAIDSRDDITLMLYLIGGIMVFITLGIAAVLVAIDQIIKFFVSQNLKPIGSVEIIDNLLSFTYVENRGVAFGMFAGARWVFVGLTAIVITILVVAVIRKRNVQTLAYISIAMVIGGGLGNLIDRVLYGFVVDYISLSFFPPVCNFADYCVTIGVILFAYYEIRKEHQEKIKRFEKNG